MSELPGGPLERVRVAFLRNVPAAFYRNMGWQTISGVVTIAFGFLMSVVVGRALGAAEFGLMALGLAYAAVVFQLVELRLHEAVIRYISEFLENREFDRVVATVKLSLLADVASGLIAVTLAVALLPWVSAQIMRDSRAPLVIFLSVLATFFTNVATATSTGVLRVLDAFRVQALITVVGGTARFVLIVIAVVAAHRGILTVLMISAVFSFLINAAIIGAALRRLNAALPAIRPKGRLSCVQPRLQEMTRFVGTTYLLSLVTVPTKDLDINVLGIFSTAHVVGVYKIAKNFMAALWALSDAAFLAVYPEISKMWARRHFVELRSMVRRLTVVFGLSGVGIFIASFLIVPSAIVLLMGADFAGAGTIFQFMVWGFLFWAPFFWINPVLLAAGRPDLTVKAALITGIVMLGLYVALVPRFGGVGAAVTYAFASPGTVFLALAFARRARIEGVFTR